MRDTVPSTQKVGHGDGNHEDGRDETACHNGAVHCMDTIDLCRHRQRKDQGPT